VTSPLRTPLCELLKIPYPILNAGIGPAGTAPPDFDGDIALAPLWAGDSVSNVNDILPAAEIIRSLVRDAEADLISREQS